MLLRSELRIGKMFTARKKIIKDKGAEPTEFDDTVAQASCLDCSLCVFFSHLC